MHSKAEQMSRDGQSGMALMAVMAMLVIMTIIGTGMYKLVQTSIGVTSGFSRRATTRSVAVAQASLVFETVSVSVTTGTIVLMPGLLQSNPDALKDMYGAAGNDIALDSTTLNPDFTYTMGRITARADVDFMQAIPTAGGSIEFASAYDGIGNGQALGAGFLIENQVNITATDPSGARTNLRFVVTQ